MEEQSKDISDFIGAFRRYRRKILSIFIVIFGITAVAAVLWPPTYRSSATILIESQEVPQDLVRSTITSFATQRIQQIQARVMSRTHLMNIIDQYGLYEDELRTQTTEQVIEMMRKDIALDVISADVVDPRSGRPSTAAIAFSIAYDGQVPTQVQRVVNELVSLYLSENLKTRSERTEETHLFLRKESGDLSKSIAEIEARLAQFKENNLHALPELVQLNQQLLERTETHIRDSRNKLERLDERRFYIQGQLQQVEPHMTMTPGAAAVILDPEIRLKALSADFLSLKAKYSDTHPDVVRLKKEIDALERETGVTVMDAEIEEQIAVVRVDLSRAKERYSAEHPDVARLEQKLAGLEEELVASRAAQDEASDTADNPNNPAYINLLTQLDQVKNDALHARANLDGFLAKQEEYESRLVKAPQVERGYSAIVRERESLLRRFQEVRGKVMEAGVAQQLEEESKGERFVLIDPPQLPEKPVKPNRGAIIFLGFILALGASLTFLMIAEGLDNAVRGAKGIESLFDIPPLATVPYLSTAEELADKQTLYTRLITVGAGGTVAAIAILHFIIIPLDVLWFRVLRKLSVVLGL